jgi:hypothetical protein
MKSLAEIGERELVWRQPHFGTRRFELCAGDDVVAHLTWERALGSLAVAEAFGDRYTFKRTGFLHPQATIRREGSDINLGVFTPAFGGSGPLKLANAPPYRWAATSFWSTRWAWLVDEEHPAVSFAPTMGFIRREAVVTLEPGACERGEAALLVLFGWYLMLLHSDGVAAGAAVVAACG